MEGRGGEGGEGRGGREIYSVKFDRRLYMYYNYYYKFCTCEDCDFGDTLSCTYSQTRFYVCVLNYCDLIFVSQWLPQIHQYKAHTKHNVRFISCDGHQLYARGVDHEVEGMHYIEMHRGPAAYVLDPPPSRGRDLELEGGVNACHVEYV